MSARAALLACFFVASVSAWAAPSVRLPGASALSPGEQVKVEVGGGQHKVGDRVDLVDDSAGAVVQCRVAKVLGAGQLLLKVIPEES